MKIMVLARTGAVRALTKLREPTRRHAVFFGDIPPGVLPSSEWLYLWQGRVHVLQIIPLQNLKPCLLSNDGLPLSELLTRSLFVLGRPNYLYSVSVFVHVPNLCVN